MIDGYQITNQNTPRLDPNGPTGPSGPTGHTGSTSSHTGGYYNYQGASKGSTGTSIGSGATGSSKNSNTISLPNGTFVNIPYSGGWYYNIAIPAIPAEKAVAVKKDDRDGCDCVKCKQFFEFAEPNQEDGTLICWACRHGY